MLVEVRISARNSSRLLQKGAKEIAPQILPLMTVLYILMFLGSFLEYLFAARAISFLWTIGFGGLFLLAKALKFWAVSTLGPHWTMKVLILPENEVITTGPYRWIRHPNYLAVLMEIAGTVLLGKCYITFVTVFLSFLLVLFYRIRAEEDALLRYTNYGSQMAFKSRFLP